MEVENVLKGLEWKHSNEPEFLQAVKEVLISIRDVYNQHPEFERAKIIERLVEPERVHMFRVPWVDDRGEVHVNTGYRVQFNSAIEEMLRRALATWVIRLLALPEWHPLLRH